MPVFRLALPFVCDRLQLKSSLEEITVNPKAAHLLAEFLTAAEWSEDSVQQLFRTIPELPKLKTELQRRIVGRIFEHSEFASDIPASFQLAQFLTHDSEIQRLVGFVDGPINAWAKQLSPLQQPQARMNPAPAARGWSVPEIISIGQLTEQLDVSPRHLDWLADRRGFEHRAKDESLRNYHYAWVRKRSGGYRLLEAPKATLKRLQRWIADSILRPIPVHDAAHAFRTGRSAITAADRHQRRDVVLRIDLSDFFASIRLSRIAGIFRFVGYPSSVARTLAALCTTTAWQGIAELHPAAIGEGVIEVRQRLCRPYFVPHVAQGAPSSPALANLAAFKLDCRLAGLAKRFDASYTRYADDLVFSGNRRFGRNLREFRLLVCSICMDEGFEIRHRKTLVMRNNCQQRVTGIVVNETAAVARYERDRLKAILHNCQKKGVASQCDGNPLEFRDHLAGKISWVTQVNPQHGAKLKAAFDCIDWNGA